MEKKIINKNEILEDIKFNINQILKEKLPSCTRVEIRKEINNIINIYKD